MRSRRNRLFLGTLYLALAATTYACSDDDDDAGLSGGSGAVAGKAGSSSTGGSTGSGGTTARGGSGATSGSTGSGNTGNLPTEACPGLPFDDGSSGGEPGGDGGASGASAGGASAGGAPAGGATSSEGGAEGEEACVGIAYEAERIDVDMFIMLDASQSMGYTIQGTDMTRWEAVTQAVEEFAQSPDAEDIGAGIGFFSISGIGDDDLDCDPGDYADPIVGIGPLSETSADILAAMADKTPAGLTPTGAALEGAIDYAKSWAEDHPDRATVVVLVSDGYPTQCGHGPEDVAAIAKAGYESDPHVRTYVIGVGNVARFNLENYARAGGTREPYLTDDDENAAESFVEALLNITGQEIACEYEIPDPPDNMQVDPEKVQIVYTPQGGDPEEVPKVNTLGDCADAENGGWFYDNDSAPTRIYVCPCTCARFGAGSVDVRLGCRPRLGLR